MRQFPLRSLVLLILTYAMLGGTVAEHVQLWDLLLLVVVWIALRILALIFPNFTLENWIYCCIRSDATVFLGLTIAAALVSVAITWLHIFLPIFLVIAVEFLARIELRSAKFGGWRSFFLLSFIQPTSASLGWAVMNHFIR